MATKLERIEGLRAEKHVFLVQEIVEEQGERRVIPCVFEGTESGERYACEWAERVTQDSKRFPNAVETILTINLVCPDGTHPADYTPGEYEFIQRWSRTAKTKTEDTTMDAIQNEIFAVADQLFRLGFSVQMHADRIAQLQEQNWEWEETSEDDLLSTLRESKTIIGLALVNFAKIR